MKERWLVVDIGTGSAKAALMGEGRILAAASAGYETAHGDGGSVEQDANDWWRAVSVCCRELGPVDALAGIALSGQMQDVVLLDAQARPVRPVMLYSDLRAHEQSARLHELVDGAELVKITGNHQTAGSLLAKLRWLREHEPGVISRAAHLVFGGADFVAARMTGVFATDSTTASTTGLWNLAAGNLLDAGLLTRLELAWARELLPRVVAGGARIGQLGASAAAALGMPAGAPVHLGPGDAGSATIGAGCGERGPAYAYVGSSGWVGLSASSIGDAAAGVMSLSHPKPGRVIQVAPMMTSAGNLSWLRDIFASDSYDDIITRAVNSEPARLIFLPYLNGERAPFDDPFARGAFIGISSGTDRAALYRAVLEGLVFAYRHTLSALTPQLPASLTLIGGGARNDNLNQLFADIIGLPVISPPAAENAGLHGALRAAQVALGQRDDYAIPPAPDARAWQPDPRYREHYARNYQHYLAAYQALKPLFRQLAG